MLRHWKALVWAGGERVEEGVAGRKWQARSGIWAGHARLLSLSRRRGLRLPSLSATLPRQKQFAGLDTPALHPSPSRITRCSEVKGRAAVDDDTSTPETPRSLQTSPCLFSLGNDETRPSASA
tara:strand:+ start:5637 stop:6005 length:369 start_codon:yes stop_codon:yes gene_type:complete